MTDSFMYELDDIVWDEYGQADDHIVPHPCKGHANENSLQSNSSKNARHEVTDVSSSAIDNCTTRCSNQEKDQENSQTVNKTRSSMLEKDHWSQIPDNVFSDSCITTDPTQDTTSLASDKNRMLSDDDIIFTEQETAVDTGLFNNGCIDKESNDLIYYGWPDIGNFEDVDDMFRNCDSSFRLRDAGHQDELGWFSSSEVIEGSEDPLKSEYKFPCPNSKRSAGLSRRGSCQSLNVDEPATVSHLSLMNVSDQNWRAHSSTCLQTSVPYLHSEYYLPSDQTTISPTISRFTQKSNGPTSLSPKDSHDHLLEATRFMLDDDTKKPNGRQGFQQSFTSKNVKDFGIQSSVCDPVSVQMDFQHSDINLQNDSDVEKLCYLNVKESPSMNSKPQDISLEASSFCQLQQVMEKLDLQTKLCIRHSLFRLARSAEQRHNYENLNGRSDSNAEFIATGSTKCAGFMDIETDTNPIDRFIAHLLFHRPLDSSTRLPHNVAPLKSHLNTNICEAMTSGLPVMDQKLVCHDESAIETDRKAADQ